MAKVGLTHGGFYAHFESKDDLVASAIGQMFEEASRRLSHVTDDKSPVAALCAYIDFYLSPEHRDSVATGCPMPLLAPELRRIGRPARQQFSAGVARLSTVVAEQLSKLGRTEPEADASSMLAEMIGALSLARAEGDAQRSANILEVSQRALRSRFGLQ
jgi:TetR/AcrR family transcriptional repressor of nem operon